MTEQKFTHRVRRCDGNKAAWLFVRLNSDGTESEAFGSYYTAMSLDNLLALAGNLRIELIHTPAPPR